MIDLKSMLGFLKSYEGEQIKIMEVCGTHTAAISENGIPEILSPSIKLISGPGCPVCVTVASYIDKLCDLSLSENTCVVTFGDMIRVRGSENSLNDAKANGANVKMIYSPFEIIDMAKNDVATTFILAAVGFETTTPIYAVLMEQILEENIKNIKLLTALKTMPSVIETVCKSDSCPNGFIAPGNVSVITGSDMYKTLAEKYGIPFAIAGFDAESLIQAIYTIVKLKGCGVVKNLYSEAVTQNGNLKAKEMVNKYFCPSPTAWRGLGIIDNSGMFIRDEYAFLDAGSKELTTDNAKRDGCRCSDVICGKISPTQCNLFGKICTPSEPYGTCMVSTEGSCFNYFINRRV